MVHAGSGHLAQALGLPVHVEGVVRRVLGILAALSRVDAIGGDLEDRDRGSTRRPGEAVMRPKYAPDALLRSADPSAPALPAELAAGWDALPRESRAVAV